MCPLLPSIDDRFIAKVRVRPLVSDTVGVERGALLIGIMRFQAYTSPGANPRIREGCEVIIEKASAISLVLVGSCGFAPGYSGNDSLGCRRFSVLRSPWGRDNIRYDSGYLLDPHWIMSSLCFRVDEPEECCAIRPSTLEPADWHMQHQIRWRELGRHHLTPGNVIFPKTALPWKANDPQSSLQKQTSWSIIDLKWETSMNWNHTQNNSAT